jgi:hypothetical protein
MVNTNYNLTGICCKVVRVPGYRSRGPGFDSRRYQIFWEVVGLERGPLSLVRITEELLEWKSSGSGSRKNRDYGRGDPLRWPRDTLYQLKLALTSPRGSGRSVGIVRLRTKTTEFFICCKIVGATRNQNTCRPGTLHFSLVGIRRWTFCELERCEQR